jgi:hypothetical protein
MSRTSAKIFMKQKKRKKKYVSAIQGKKSNTSKIYSSFYDIDG